MISFCVFRLASTVCSTLSFFRCSNENLQFLLVQEVSFLLKPEVQTHLKIPKELWASFKFICADHFEPSNLTNGERKRLKYDAFPTIFPQPLESYFEQFFDAEVREGVNKNIATGKCHQPSLLFTSLTIPASLTFICQRLVSDSLSYPFFY